MKKFIVLLILISLMGDMPPGKTTRFEDFGLVLEEEEIFRVRIDLFNDFDLIDVFIESNSTFDVIIIDPLMMKLELNISYMKEWAYKDYNNIYSYNYTFSRSDYEFYIYNPHNYSILIHYILEGNNIEKDNDLSYEFSIAAQILCCMILLIGIPLVPVIILVFYLIKKGKSKGID